MHYTFVIDSELSRKFKTVTVRCAKLVQGTPQQVVGQTLLYLKAQMPLNQQALYDLLADDEIYFRSIEGKNPRLEINKTFDFFRLRPGKTIKHLQKMATSKIFYNEKPLVCDFFSQLKPHYFISEKEKEVDVLLQLQDAIHSWTLGENSIAFAGPPCLIIQEGYIKIIHESLSWKEIQLFLEKSPKIFTKAQYRLWYEDLFLDEDNPPNIHLATTRVPITRQDPLPVLQLVDQTGAFCNLLMDYKTETYLPFYVHETEHKRLFDRMEGAEKDLEKDLLEVGYVRKTMANSHYFCPLDQAKMKLEFLHEVGWSIIDQKGRHMVKPTDLELFLSEADETFVLRGNITCGTEKINLEDVLTSLQKKENFFPISDTKVALLSEKNQFLHPLYSFLDEIEIVAGKAKIKKHHIGYLSDLLSSDSVSIDFESTHLKQHIESQRDREKLEQRPLGSNFQGCLRPYQQTGVNWLYSLYQREQGSLLADEMGLGKTVQVLAFLSLLGPTSKILIIVPTSLLFNWEKELTNFLPQANFCVYHGPLRTGAQIEKSPIILTSYGIIRSETKKFLPHHFDVIILDEAQCIKNFTTQTAQAIFHLKSSYRLSLTGTPIENSFTELWTHFRFLQPDLLGSKQDFESTMVSSNADMVSRVRKKIAPYILRRKKEEVAKDLPDKIEQTVFVTMNEEEKALYDQFLSSFKAGLLQKIAQEGVKKYKLEALEVLLRLRQITCHPLLISHILEKPVTSSGKFDLLFTDIETLVAQGKKIVIFSQFAKMLALMRNEADRRGFTSELLDGETKDRKKVVDSFQNRLETSLFFISLHAGGVGLNLTAADYILLYDPWWNEAVENQAISRAHRIGRKDTVFCKRYITKDTVEEKMLLLKKIKKQTAETLITSGSAEDIYSDDDLLNLLH